MELKQLQMAKFEYKIKGGRLFLYDRTDTPKQKDARRFLVSVKFDGNVQSSVKTAVEKLYGSLVNPMKMIIQAKDMFSKRELVEYVRHES